MLLGYVWYVITLTDTQGFIGVDLCSLRQWRSDGGLWPTMAQTAWPFANCRGSARDMNQRLFVFPTAKGLTLEMCTSITELE